MEKTTKKKKSKKGLKKRIGIIAVGGLSLVLTVCLSVGATLAWFAGSTWSSESLFMGGPVYVEMAGRGTATSTDGSGTANWKGGAGHLDIQAATARNTGTAGDKNQGASGTPGNVLLPGERYEIYSQARVYSTAYTDSTTSNPLTSNSSGADVTNTSYADGSGTVHYRSDGRVTTATTSVLRARFSVKFEFDPYVGFNNFKDKTYADNYPEKSTAYSGDIGTDASIAGKTLWSDALGKALYTNETKTTTRRDAVPNEDGEFTNVVTAGTKIGADTKTALERIKEGSIKSIYAWKFVSYNVWKNAQPKATAITTGTNTLADIDEDKSTKYLQMGAPFDGTVQTAGGVGFYGVWILQEGEDDTLELTESNAFYSERCNNYLGSYVEEYYTEYGGLTNRQVGTMLKQFESDLNNSFIDLINDSSDEIHKGKVYGNTISNGVMTYAGTSDEWNAAKAVLDQDGDSETGNSSASWLYVNPALGNDTNTNELSTGVGGWWYLVCTDNKSAASHEMSVWTEIDDITEGGTLDENTAEIVTDVTNGFTPGSAYMNETDTTSEMAENIMSAKLYEVTPNITTALNYGTNGKVETSPGVYEDVLVSKVVSYSFPFVNGPNYLPTSLTNIFANAKITFQVSFQALQAFFPWSATIDGLSYKSPIMGTAKALNIGNSIPIFNEAFAYEY